METRSAVPTTNSFTEALRRPSRNFPRSTSGCLTCRQRKKKCDEQHPTCSGCLRSHVACRWPAPSAPTRSPTPLATGMRLKQQELRQSYINTEAIAVWNLSRLTFLSPERPCFLTKISGTLLEHYVTRTGTHLVPFPPSCNPCIWEFLIRPYSQGPARYNNRSPRRIVHTGLDVYLLSFDVDMLEAGSYGGGEPCAQELCASSSIVASTWATTSNGISVRLNSTNFPAHSNTKDAQSL